MPQAPHEYRRVVAGEWRLYVMPAQWSGAVEAEVLRLVEIQVFQKHPQTLTVRPAAADQNRAFFLKVFHRRRGLAAIKDLIEQSKAKRFWRQSLALQSRGFGAPRVVACGERHRFGIVSRSFVLTEEVPGERLPEYFGRRGAWRSSKEKWQGVDALGATIGHFHREGFVHGDLLASNLFVARAADDAWQFYFMDNDRTRRFPQWLPQQGWRRNLVQLNRLPLSNITLQDRLRFFRAYVGSGYGSLSARKLLAWIEQRTRQRRLECDGVDPTMPLRRLLRVPGRSAS